MVKEMEAKIAGRGYEYLTDPNVASRAFKPDGTIVPLTQYGNTYITSEQASELRGSGRWNPTPVGPSAYPYRCHHQTPKTVERGYAPYKLNPTTLQNSAGHWSQNTSRKFSNVLQNGFMSDANVLYLQKELQKLMRKETGVSVGLEDKTQLIAAMNNVFMMSEYSRETDRNATVIGTKGVCDPQSKIVQLNRAFIGYVLPSMLSKMHERAYFLRDQGSIPDPMKHPTYVSGPRNSETVGRVAFEDWYRPGANVYAFNNAAGRVAQHPWYTNPTPSCGV